MYNLVPVSCDRCSKELYKTNAMQEHMIREHGIYTRVCLQCTDNERILGGHAIDLSKPICIPEDLRAKACESVRNSPAVLVCDLCGKESASYTQLKTHLDKSHHIQSRVCLTRMYNDEIVCRNKKPNATGAAVAAVAPVATVAPDTAGPTSMMQTYQGQGQDEVGTAVNPTIVPPRVQSVSMFGNVKIIKLFREPEEPNPAFALEALEEEAYACDDCSTKSDEVYARFEAQERVEPNYSLYRGVNGEAFMASFESGSRVVAFKYGHINADDMIDHLVKGTLTAFSFFLKSLFENTYNRFLYKRSSGFPFTDVHLRYGQWVVNHDSYVFPCVVESAAAAMRKFVNNISGTPRFMQVFNGSRDYENVMNFIHVIGIVRNTNDLDEDYARDMLHYFYRYVKEARTIVADYSDEADVPPWVSYPATDPVS